MAHSDSKWAKLLKKSRPKSFPDAIVFDILSRLPVKSVLRFNSVCKKWYALFGETQFIEAPLNRPVKGSDRCYLVTKMKETGDAFSLCREENFEEFCKLHFKYSYRYTVIASADGIVCIRRFFPTRRRNKKIMGALDIMPWNPATRELRTLPKFLGQDFSFGFGLGFGFDSKNSDFKSVGIFQSKDSIKLKVYSLKSDSWSTVKVHSYEFLRSYAVYVNDRVHWLGSNPTHDLIISFDVTEEKIIEMDVPELAPNNYPLLRESPASLGKPLILYHRGHEGECQIWFMKEHGDSWTKLYSLPPHPVYGELLSLGIFLDNGEIIMRCVVGEMLLYDPRNQVDKILNVEDGFDAVNYRESLVSVKRGGSISNTNHSASISNCSIGNY